MSDGGAPAGPAATRRVRVVRVARRMTEEWTHDRLPDTAAAVAFWAILSLLPTVLAVAALLGPLDSLVGGDLATRVQNEVIGFLGRVLTSEADGTIDAARNLFEQERPGLLTFSLLATLWTVSRAFAGLVRALDVVYELPERRTWLRLRLVALGIAVGTLLASALLLAVLVLGPLLGTGVEIADRIGLGAQFAFAWDVLRLPVAVAVLVLWATTVFHIAPDHRTPWRWDLPGAVLTTILWLTFSVAFRLYLELAQAGNAVFGALGGALIVLLWLWLLALAVLLGGELNQILREERGLVPSRPAGDSSAGVEGVAQLAHERAGLDGRATVEEDAHDGGGDDDPVGGGGGGHRRLR
jgi:membrane protein